MLEVIVIYLAAAIAAVPIAKRLGLGSVLGYLLAGMLIGPFILGLVGDQSEVMHYAEFGVVMMLFLIGLELQPRRLWKLRHSIVLQGGLQLALTTLVIWAFCYFVFALRWQTALALGVMLALSSTAIVLQTLSEKGWIKQPAGQNAFSILLFQDIAVIPIMALLPLLAFTDITSSIENHDSLIMGFPVWVQVVISVLVISSIYFVGKYISTPLFRYIAETRLREIFTVFALFLVVSIALIMEKIGLSPALGTFLAGVVLAESEFRHELETDIEPFKGLLLGLFFIAVGASIDFLLLAEELLLIVYLVIGLILLKALILYFIAFVFKLKSKQKILFTFALAQGGEFAFVLISLTGSLYILTPEQSKITTLVVTISMLFAPILLMLYERFLLTDKVNNEYDDPAQIEPTNNVIIVGYGRFGQVVGRLLTAQGYHLSILDHSPAQIDLVRRFGVKVFYGDAARGDLLKAAGAKQAKLLVIAVDDAIKALEIIDIAQKYFPNLKIAVRATDRTHAYEIMNKGVTTFRRESFDSAINLGVDALSLLGEEPDVAQKAGRLFKQYDEKALLELSSVWGDDKHYGAAVRQHLEDLKQILDKDKAQQKKLNVCEEDWLARKVVIKDNVPENSVLKLKKPALKKQAF
ncbi:potassium transporter [Psychromonas sp. RZ22]|uniref:monovalent cation:proton antiporter-2 (CPA2) family protein n=1 Tax=Psychromonas algarum TaxID=2555643 RepID=UPI0010675EDB|nr:monovalent cation:proton antiporter-2 (CPA2) family protein [Psychromonas sp. RZ22]TEW56732.1 potassium transporter [Psychromonas sp. RZ22]